MTAWNARVLQRLRSPVLEALAGEPGVWVVGGAVRDALLGREPRELDLVVEGDAVALARRIGVPRAVHERFGTATIDGADFATARRERYARPGALPDVQLGATIEQDLARRDFSVHALAVRLADGEGAAWPGALEDLERGLLRVLHERSFLDDPTRLLRLARYAARLGFAADPVTDVLAAEAVAARAPATVSGPRAGAEVRLALEREPLPAVLRALARHGLGTAVVHPAFDPDRVPLDDVLAAVPPGAHPGLAALGATLLGADGVPAALDRLGFPAPERDAVAAAAAAAPLAERLRAAGTPSAVADAVRHQPPEALAVAAALGAGEPVRRWLADWRHRRPAITGEDLLAAGVSGPAVGIGLRAAAAALLDGRAPDRDRQLEIALAAARTG
jgi:tRNA nucleotidyltransferase (CCA-adding enzyme)